MGKDGARGKGAPKKFNNLPCIFFKKNYIFIYNDSPNFFYFFFTLLRKNEIFFRP